MAVSYVQTKNANGTGNSLTCAFTSSPGAGHGLVVFIGCVNASATVSSISDTNSNAFVLVTSENEATHGFKSFCYYVKANSTTAADTVSVTLNSSGGFIELVLYEVNPGGSFTQIILDQSAISNTNSTSISIGPTGTLAAASEFAAAYAVLQGSLASTGSGWTDDVLSSGNLAERIVTTVTTALTATGSQTASGYCGIMATFQGTSVTTLHFAMAMADTSSVTLGFHGAVTTLHFALVMADTSSVTLGFHGGTVLAPPAPTCVQHVAFGMENNAATNVTLPFPNLTLSGNLLIVGFQFQNAGSITSVTDNIGNTYTAAVSVLNNTAYAQKMVLYYCAGATAGVTAIKVTLSGLAVINTDFSGFHAVISEWYNVATSSPVDGTSVSNVSSVAPGTITTTQAGDLIYHWAVDIQSFYDGAYGGGYNGTSISVGSGFTLLSADLQVGSADQYQIQSAAGAISPTLTPSGSKTWASIAVAFKALAAGTAPSVNAMRVVGVQHTCLGNLRTSPNQPPIPLQFPSRGNLLVGLFNSPTTFVTGASDSLSNTWTAPVAAQSLLGSAYANIFWAANARTGPGLGSITLTMSDTFQSMLLLYDIVNATPSPFDNAVTGTGTQTTAGNLSTPPSITPSTAGGIVFGTVAINLGTAAGTTTAGGIFDAAVNALDTDASGGTGNSALDEDNCYGHLYNGSTSAVSWGWTFTTGSPGVQGWSYVAVAFKSFTPAFPIQVSDTSTVLALGLEVQRRFPVQITDTSAVLALGFHITVQRFFPIQVADTSAVLALGFHIVVPGHFPIQVADTSTVLKLGFTVTRRFSMAIADSSTVLLGFQRTVPRYPVLVTDTSSVFIGFENDHSTLGEPLGPLIVPPYAGQNQEELIEVTADIAWRESQREEGPWVMPPYAGIFPEVANAQIEERGTTQVPPPISKTDLWKAMQTWPL